jgi:hypothetical protein
MERETMYSEEEMKKWPVEEQQKLELHGYESIIEAEMQLAEQMPANGFVRDSGDGEYWLGHFETGAPFFEDNLNDLLHSLTLYLTDVQFESRELVLQGLAFAKSIVGECKKNTGHWLSGLDPCGEPITCQQE